MSDLKQQANIVKQNLYYHFADSCGNWMIPDDMKFLNEVLNDIMKLCKLANDVSDEPQTATCNIPHVSDTVCDHRYHSRNGRYMLYEGWCEKCGTDISQTGR